MGAANLRTSIVSRMSGETLSQYRNRLAVTVKDAKDRHREIRLEAPESDAVTAHIPSGLAQIHIRLHLSRQLGAYIQGADICYETLALERQEVARAGFVSAPSKSACCASSLLFDLPSKINCYPNPAPSWTKQSRPQDTADPIDVLFVGRFQHLKGAPWVLEFAKVLPQLSFAVACPKRDQNAYGRIPRNLRFIDVSTWSKYDTYRAARLVIIPSIYETASMVGIEALAAGTPIVSWQHLGIAEYAAAPLVTLIEPYQVKAFAAAIQKTVDAQSVNTAPLTAAETLDTLFLKGTQATFDGQSGAFMPVNLNETIALEIPKIISKPKELNALLAQNPDKLWRRKIRKLQRDPIRFVKDARIAQLFTRPGSQIRPNMIADQEKKPTPAIRPTTKRTSPQEFVNISETNRIEFQKPPEKTVGLITAFLFPESQPYAGQAIIDGLSAFDDFRHVRPPMLQVGRFKSDLSQGVTDIVERIDRVNKERVAGIDHLIMLNPPPALVSALRACGTRQRMIVILDHQDALPPDPWHTDVLIVVGKTHPMSQTLGWRRKIVVQDSPHLSLAIRRAVQEGAPKSPDFLLPMIGFQGTYRDALLATDHRFHQGIIYTKPGYKPPAGNMATQCQALSNALTDLAVTESVYLRYRSLCDQMDDNQSRLKFLSYSLYDGVMFDVRT
ncbi:glycosyltransferase [Yoonia sp. BS5-3]|uniref:Glycosyltransferase n=1 Tax=Yoonia phaeophyticola TaxID=3137369 RepID=A0ABZ3IDP2_9RHOB